MKKEFKYINKIFLQELFKNFLEKSKNKKNFNHYPAS